MPSTSSSVRVSPADGERPSEKSATACGDAGFGVYVHWPFCLSKCPYCDFNSHVRESIDQDRWRQALITDLAHALDRANGQVSGRVSSVFFGGGTPSLMAPKTVAGVLEVISRRDLLSAGAEITLEANPSSAEAKRFAAYREAGVNRLSIGVQALDDDALKLLGRAHDVEEALGALSMARDVFDRVSFDLIYARSGQSRQAWRGELERVLALGPTHVSLYQLVIERGTRFHEAHARGDLVLPDDDEAAAMYEDTQARCRTAGLEAYEVSNYARPGDECRHNLVYWRYGDWLGAGPGAHGRLGRGDGRVATRQIRSPEKWLEAVERSGSGIEAWETLDAETRAAEMLMMGLRLTEGVSADRFERMVGGALADILSRDRLDDFVADGLLVSSASAIRATPRGRSVLNSVVSALLP